MRKKFSFIFPVSDAVKDKSRREGITYTHICDWRVNGEASITKTSSAFADKILKFEIEEILYDGTDINPVLKTVEIVEAVKAACLNHVQNLFEEVSETPAHHKIGNPLGKIIYMPLVMRRKVK